MDGIINLPDGTAITITGVSLEEAEGLPHGSGFVSTAAGGQLRTAPRDGGHLTLTDRREGAITIDDVQTKARTGMPAITTLRFTLPAGWTIGTP